MKAFMLKIWLRATHIDDEDRYSQWGMELVIPVIFIANTITHGYCIPGLISEMGHEPKALCALVYCGLMVTLSGLLSLAGLWHLAIKFYHRKPWQATQTCHL